MRIELVILLITFAIGCVDVEQPPVIVEPMSHKVWPADQELRSLLSDASRRVNDASGLVIEVAGEDDPFNAIPFFRTTTCFEGCLGFYHVGSNEFMVLDEQAPEWIRESVTLHELLHSLGVEHVLEESGFLMSPNVTGAWPITERELVMLCELQDCLKFEPEAP